MLRSRLGILWYRLLRVRIKVRTGAVVLPQYAPEWVRRHDESADGVGRLAQLLGAMESALVPIHAESQDMTHIGVGFHGANQHDVVPGGEGGEFVPIPGAGVFGDAQAAQSQAFRLKNELFRRQAGIGAALGRMDV